MMSGMPLKTCWAFNKRFRLDYGRSPHAYVNWRLQIQLELLMMSGMPLKTCWAFHERWNNKFYYKVASCWLFLLSHISHSWKPRKISTRSVNLRKQNLLTTLYSTFLHSFFVLLYFATYTLISFINTWAIVTERWTKQTHTIVTQI